MKKILVILIIIASLGILVVKTNILDRVFYNKNLSAFNDTIERNLIPETDSTYLVGRDGLEYLWGRFDNLKTTNSSSTNATSTGTVSATTLEVNDDYISDFTGTNLSVTNGVLNAAGGSGVNDWQVVFPAPNQTISPTSTNNLTGLYVTASSTFKTLRVSDGLNATTTVTNKLTVVENATDNLLFLESTAANTTGAFMEMYHNSVSPNSLDASGIEWYFNNSVPSKQIFSDIYCYPQTTTNGQEDAECVWQSIYNGSLSTVYSFNSDGNAGFIFGVDTVPLVLESNNANFTLVAGGTENATTTIETGTNANIWLKSRGTGKVNMEGSASTTGSFVVGTGLGTQTLSSGDLFISNDATTTGSLATTDFTMTGALNLPANIITDAMTSNTLTCSAFVTNPTDCTNQFANAIDTAGNLTCATVNSTYMDMTANYTWTGMIQAKAATTTQDSLIQGQLAVGQSTSATSTFQVLGTSYFFGNATSTGRWAFGDDTSTATSTLEVGNTEATNNGCLQLEADGGVAHRCYICGATICCEAGTCQ